MKERKNQFISLPWKICKITLRNASKNNEYAVQFDQYNLKLENQVKGFDPQQYFKNHMTFVGFSVSYINTYYLEKKKKKMATTLKKFQLDILKLLSVLMNLIENTEGL
jgi:hypothetical protein